MASVNQLYYDDETGEILTYNINNETGELCMPETMPTAVSRIKMEPKKQNIFPTGYGTRTEKFRTLKENILAGSNTVSYRMLLIPAALVFSSVVTIFLMILEVYLHVICHKKNKLLKNPNLYYRSPFHVVTSNFCAVCREHDAAFKIGLLQDQRRNRYDYLRGLAI